MEFNFSDSTLFEFNDNEKMDHNSYFIISKNETVKEDDFENVIKIIDEQGKEVSCTYDKFVEIFDTEGLNGFII